MDLSAIVRHEAEAFLQSASLSIEEKLSAKGIGCDLVHESELQDVLRVKVSAAEELGGAHHAGRSQIFAAVQEALHGD